MENEELRYHVRPNSSTPIMNRTHRVAKSRTWRQNTTVVEEIPKYRPRPTRYTPFSTATDGIIPASINVPNMFAKVHKQFNSPQRNLQRKRPVQFDDLLVCEIPAGVRTLRRPSSSDEEEDSSKDQKEFFDRKRQAFHCRLMTMEKTMPAHRIGRYSRYLQKQFDSRIKQESTELRWKSVAVGNRSHKSETAELVSTKSTQSSWRNFESKAIRNGRMTERKVYVDGAWIDLVTVCSSMLYDVMQRQTNIILNTFEAKLSKTPPRRDMSAEHDKTPPSAGGAKGQASSPLPSPERTTVNRMHEKTMTYMVQKFARRVESDHRTTVAAVYYLLHSGAKLFHIMTDNVVLMFATALMLAQKFHEDVYCADDYWASSLKISLMEQRVHTGASSTLGEISEDQMEFDLERLVKMEKHMLEALQWDLYVTIEQLEEFVLQFYASK